MKFEDCNVCKRLIKMPPQTDEFADEMEHAGHLKATHQKYPTFHEKSPRNAHLWEHHCPSCTCMKTDYILIEGNFR